MNDIRPIVIYLTGPMGGGPIEGLIHSSENLNPLNVCWETHQTKMWTPITPPVPPSPCLYLK